MSLRYLPAARLPFNGQLRALVPGDERLQRIAMEGQGLDALRVRVRLQVLPERNRGDPT